MRHLLLLLPLLLLASCEDANITDRAQCDGVLNSAEQTVDDAFDADGDGYVDAENVECQAAYDAAELDCRDDDAATPPRRTARTSTGTASTPATTASTTTRT